MNRRQFLGLATATTAAMMLDPERLLWVPGAKTFFLPSQQITTVTTIEEALRVGLVAIVPNGHSGFARMEIALTAQGRTLDERLAREVADIRRIGGRVIERRSYVTKAL